MILCQEVKRSLGLICRVMKSLVMKMSLSLNDEDVKQERIECSDEDEPESSDGDAKQEMLCVVGRVSSLQVMLFICFSRNLQGLPIFEQPPPKYSTHRIMEILLNPNMNKSLVTHDRPLQVEKSSTFVVDLTSLKHPDDVKKDMYGRWDYSG